MRTLRAAINPVVDQHDNISLFATLPCSHTRIPSRHPDIVAAAVDSLARAVRPAAR